MHTKQIQSDRYRQTDIDLEGHIHRQTQTEKNIQIKRQIY